MPSQIDRRLPHGNCRERHAQGRKDDAHANSRAVLLGELPEGETLCHGDFSSLHNVIRDRARWPAIGSWPCRRRSGAAGSPEVTRSFHHTAQSRRDATSNLRFNMWTCLHRRRCTFIELSRHGKRSFLSLRDPTGAVHAVGPPVASLPASDVQICVNNKGSRWPLFKVSRVLLHSTATLMRWSCNCVRAQTRQD